MKGMDTGRPLVMVLNPLVNVHMVKVEVIETMGIHAGCIFVVVHPQVRGKTLMNMQP